MGGRGFAGLERHGSCSLSGTGAPEVGAPTDARRIKMDRKTIFGMMVALMIFVGTPVLVGLIT